MSDPQLETAYSARAEKKYKKQKLKRPKAEAPRGFRDSFGSAVDDRQRMLRSITAVYRSYGFDPLETSAVENIDALGKFLPDVDRPMGGIFGFQDDEEKWVALRYDLTAPLARVAAQYRLDLPNPYRRFAVGPVWRNEKPGPGRFREFYQCDADTVGAASVAADAEICAMLADGIEAAGVARGAYRVRINNRKVLNGVLETIGIWDSASRDGGAGFFEQRMAVLRAVDKLDKFGTDGVKLLLGPGRKDESGAFTEGAGLSEDQIAHIIAFVEAGLGASGSAAACDRLRDIVGASAVGREGVSELEHIAEFLDALGLGEDRALIDPSVVRGLGYYTGPVYEAELTFDIADEKGQLRRFGSVAGGGRYDDLVMRFTGQRTPATGVSIGVDRLLSALAARRARMEEAPRAATGPVVVLVFDKNASAASLQMAAELRAAGIRAESFLGGGNMAKQLKYADKRNSPIAIIAGEDERVRGVVQIKDLILGAKLSTKIESHEEWKAQPAQSEAARGSLVEAVKTVLARHGLEAQKFDRG
jgi:histidyl-tRNA synthetase